MPVEIVYVLNQIMMDPTPMQRTELETKLVQLVLNWFELQGPSVLDQESRVINSLEQSGVRSGSIDKVKAAFATLRNAMSQVQQVAQSPQRQAIWQQMIQLVRQIFMGIRGGTASFGGAIMQVGRNVFNGVGMGAVWIGTMATGVARQAFVALGELLGGVAAAEVVAAVAIIAIVFAGFYLLKKSMEIHHPLNIQQDPVFNTMNPHMIPRMPLGNL